MRCAHERTKRLIGEAREAGADVTIPFLWCRDCGALRAQVEGGKWVKPGRAWRQAKPAKKPKKSAQLNLLEDRT